NGMGPTPTDLLTTILAYDDARGMPVANAPHSGYQRVDANGTVVLMDTGSPPPLAVSTEAHAGCLSFELSTRQNRIVVNCGLPATSRDSWRQVARSTPAHSTVTFNETSSCRFVETGPVKRLLNGAPIVSGPHRVTAERGQQDGAIVLRASHDGYAASFDIVHQRTLMLAVDGRRLDGEDVFMPAVGQVITPDRDQFSIRFHLHPSVKANRLSDAHGAMLVMANKEVWTFTAYEDRIDLEESVYLAGNDGPRRTVQLVIHGRARNVMRVQWTFALSAPPSATARRGRGEDLQLPL
ncbi:MAG TPA: heparinase II/III family protein, partial [Xanthobacteraceae bacterium]|nr:heparinase II/III family protein [Xanthobacteraceae bacterium]